MLRTEGRQATRLIPEHEVLIAEPLERDGGVQLGYCPDRPTEPLTLRIGSGARIRSGTIIYGGTTIGCRFETGHNVVIREENVIGDDVSIWSNTVIDYGSRIGDRVKIHSNAYIPQFTTIGDDVFIAPGCVFANDVFPGCADSKATMRGPFLERGVAIGVNVTILPKVRIGEYSLVGSGSVVTADIPPRSVVWGNPGRVHKTIADVNCCAGEHDCTYHNQNGVM